MEDYKEMYECFAKLKENLIKFRDKFFKPTQGNGLWIIVLSNDKEDNQLWEAYRIFYSNFALKVAEYISSLFESINPLSIWNELFFQTCFKQYITKLSMTSGVLLKHREIEHMQE